MNALPVDDLDICVGSETEVPFEFENCSSEAADMTVDAVHRRRAPDSGRVQQRPRG